MPTKANPTRTCRQCNQEFAPLMWNVKRGRGHFCSRACYDASRNTYDPARFWCNVAHGDGCWEWQGPLNGRGYGRVWWHGTRAPAHRVAWELANGPIPAGLIVCHNCPGGDNPRCCRPDHLFIGTIDDNNQDAARKGRKAMKLTPADVAEIRRLYTTGKLTQRQIAGLFGIHDSVVNEIILRKAWKHIA